MNKLLKLTCLSLLTFFLVGCWTQSETWDQSWIVEENIAEHVWEKEEDWIDQISKYFQEKALVDDISVVDCTLSDWTQTSCYKIIATHGISDEDIWPRCPRNISDTA